MERGREAAKRLPPYSPNTGDKGCACVIGAQGVSCPQELGYSTVSTVVLTFCRAEPDLEDSQRACDKPDCGLGPGRVHGVRITPEGRHPCPAEWPGRGAGYLQVNKNVYPAVGKGREGRALGSIFQG